MALSPGRMLAAVARMVVGARPVSVAGRARDQFGQDRWRQWAEHSVTVNGRGVGTESGRWAADDLDQRGIGDRIIRVRNGGRIMLWNPAGVGGSAIELDRCA